MQNEHNTYYTNDALFESAWEDSVENVSSGKYYSEETYTTMAESLQFSTKYKKIESQNHWYAIAASVAFICLSALGFWFFKQNTQQNNIPPIAQKEVFTHGDFSSDETQQLIHLSDGSAVRLLPNSSIKFNFEKNDKLREVYLKGKAEFQVAKNEEKPFWVYHKNLTTRVLGTTFLVKSSRKSPADTVFLKEGKVQVWQFGKEVATLKPGDTYIFDIQPKETEIESKENVTVYKTPTTLSVRFKQTPIQEAFAMLSAKTYWKIDDSNIRYPENLLVSLAYENQSPEEILLDLNALANFDYEEKEINKQKVIVLFEK